ncbi:MAG: PorT family protein [Fimbriimonadaceae bacterium]|nr:PorT family protein [Chitinophagales bacterium]
MKKIVSIFLFFIAGIISVHAQEFRFGLTASPVFSWLKIDGEDFQNDGSRVGFQYGLLFDQTIGSVERYAFSTGLLIDITGGQYTYADTVQVDSVTFTPVVNSVVARVQYIEIPLTIKLRTNEINYMTYYGQFGVVPGINIKARGDFTVNPDPLSHSVEDINLKEDNNNVDELSYNDFDLSLIVGAGLEYSMSENTSIVAGIFFKNGFSGVISDRFDDNAMKLKQIGIRLGVLF